MIDIKGCLRISTSNYPDSLNLDQISEIAWTWIDVYETTLVPIDLLGYFKSGLGL